MGIPLEMNEKLMDLVKNEIKTHTQDASDISVTCAAIDMLRAFDLAGYNIVKRLDPDCVCLKNASLD